MAPVADVESGAYDDDAEASPLLDEEEDTALRPSPATRPTGAAPAPGLPADARTVIDANLSMTRKAERPGRPGTAAEGTRAGCDTVVTTMSADAAVDVDVVAPIPAASSLLARGTEKAFRGGARGRIAMTAPSPPPPPPAG